MVLALPRIAEGQMAPWRENQTEEHPTPAPAGTSERYGITPDPSFTHHFQMPSARPLYLGDSMVTVAGYLGWIGVRHGFHRRFDAGLGVPFYLAGLSLDGRYALVLGESAAVSLWGYASVPFLPGDGTASDFLGFTWQGAGAAWVLGPVVSVWGPRAGVHGGAHIAQRTQLGGAWALMHATVEGVVTDSVRAIGQVVVLAEMLNERGSGARVVSLVGNTHPRVHPYVLAGLRLHSRRFAVDVGALLVLGSRSPLATGVVSVWPWLSASQVF